MNVKTLLGSALAVAILAIGIRLLDGRATDPGAVAVPELTGTAAAGRQAFADHCADCHGEHAGGTGKGPPLIHPYYVPGHHADFAFVRAVRQGVPAHHWDFGDMPPVEGVSDAELAVIVDFVRTVQRANGIE